MGAVFLDIAVAVSMRILPVHMQVSVQVCFVPAS